MLRARAPEIAFANLEPGLPVLTQPVREMTGLASLLMIALIVLGGTVTPGGH
jgi:hypothetical protein